MQEKLKKNRVDVIIPFFVPPFIGGTETVIKSWANNLKVMTGVNIRLVNTFDYKNNHFLNAQDTCSYLSYRGIFNNGAIVKKMGLLFLIWHYIRTDATAVVVLSPKYIKLASLIRRVFKKKYKIISWIHFSLSKMFQDSGRVFLLADHHLAISTGIRRQLESFGINSNEISVVYNPMERNAQTITVSSNPRFIYIGRVEIKHQKNLIEMLRGFQLFINEYNDAILEIWGDGDDRIELQEIADEMGIADKVIFHGWNKNPWKQVDSATAMLLSSTFEGLPMSILESMSRGLPVISANIETGPEDEINEYSGKLYSSGIIEDLNNKMKYIYTHPERYKRVKVKASIEKFYTKNYYINMNEILKKESY